MTQGTDPGISVVRRWQLAAAMKQLREQVGLTQDEAVELLQRGPGKWSRSKLSRIENREHNFKPRDIVQLLDIYDLTDLAKREALIQLAVDSHEPGWWLSFRDDLPTDVQPLLSIEGGLVALRDFQSQIINGLLQIPDYTRALIHTINPGMFAPEQTARMIAARLVRQRILTKENPPNLHFILDYSVLERVVGDRMIMRDQLRKLLDHATSPNITIQILPNNAGGGPGLEGPFSILTLPDPIPDIGYAESPPGSFFIEDRERVRAWTIRFGILTQQALPQEESIEMISEAMKSFE